MVAYVTRRCTRKLYSRQPMLNGVPVLFSYTFVNRYYKLCYHGSIWRPQFCNIQRLLHSIHGILSSVCSKKHIPCFLFIFTYYILHSMHPNMVLTWFCCISSLISNLLKLHLYKMSDIDTEEWQKEMYLPVAHCKYSLSVLQVVSFMCSIVGLIELVLRVFTPQNIKDKY